MWRSSVTQRAGSSKRSRARGVRSTSSKRPVATRDTAPAFGSDDIVLSRSVRAGPNLVCDTAVRTGSDDIQIVQRGSIPIPDPDGDGQDDRNIGTVPDQAGTLMHEVGHNFQLEHGGGDDIHYKPNYLSVMN